MLLEAIKPGGYLLPPGATPAWPHESHERPDETSLEALEPVSETHDGDEKTLPGKDEEAGIGVETQSEGEGGL